MSDSPPPSPVEHLSPWRDEATEALARTSLNRHLQDEELMDLRAALTEAVEDSMRASTDLKELEVEWRAEERGRWFRWGIAELEAERLAIAAYRSLCQRALARVNDAIRQRNRKINQSLQSAADARRRAEAAAAQVDHNAAQHRFATDPGLRKSQAQLIRVAYLLAEAPAEEWDREGPLGLMLRGAVADYSQTKAAMRSEQEADR